MACDGLNYLAKSTSIKSDNLSVNLAWSLHPELDLPAPTGCPPSMGHHMSVK